MGRRRRFAPPTVIGRSCPSKTNELFTLSQFFWFQLSLQHFGTTITIEKIPIVDSHELLAVHVRYVSNPPTSRPTPGFLSLAATFCSPLITWEGSRPQRGCPQYQCSAPNIQTTPRRWVSCCFTTLMTRYVSIVHDNLGGQLTRERLTSAPYPH